MSIYGGGMNPYQQNAVRSSYQNYNQFRSNYLMNPAISGYSQYTMQNALNMVGLDPYTLAQLQSQGSGGYPGMGSGMGGGTGLYDFAFGGLGLGYGDTAGMGAGGYPQLGGYQQPQPQQQQGPNPIQMILLFKIFEKLINLIDGNDSDTDKPSTNATTKTIDSLNKNFGDLDKNSNGFLEKDELTAAKDKLKDDVPEIDKLIGRMDELMFSNSDGTKEAYFGLSKKDLDAINTKVRSGKTLDQIADSNKESVIKNNNLGDKPDAFQRFIEFYRNLYQ